MSAESVNDTTKQKKKKNMKVPHILWIVLGLLVVASLLTYIIPAGEFATDANGNIIATELIYFDEQTPVSIIEALLLIFPGMSSQVSVMVLVLALGSNIAILLKTNAIENFLNWTTYKLQDKGKVVSIVILFVLMTYIGGFAGSDGLLAMVPIGIVFSKKMKLDPMVALGVTTFPAMLGFATGPSAAWIAQGMMGVTPYSGSILRLITMNVFMVIGLLYLFRYINKIEKDPKNSVMYDEGWHPEASVDEIVETDTDETELNIASVLTLIIFLGQYGFIIYNSLTGGVDTFSFMIAINIVSGLLMGVINRMNADELGNTFAQGINSMGFVIFIIGLAGAFSLIMNEGNIIDPIVYGMTRPLMNLGQGLTSVGIAVVTSIINLFIPSATSKAAIVVPIISPIAETLDITGQVGVQAYVIGDRFTNFISPVLGWTMGSLITAKVSYGKWVKWLAPILLVFIILSLILLYFLTMVNWTGV